MKTKVRSIWKKLLLKEAIKSKLKMKPHDFLHLDVMLNVLNTFIKLSIGTEISDKVYIIRSKLENVVGVVYRNPAIYSYMSLKVAEEGVWREAFSLEKQHLTDSTEIKEIFELVKQCFREPEQPPEFRCRSSTASSSSMSLNSDTSFPESHKLNTPDHDTADEGAPHSSISNKTSDCLDDSSPDSSQPCAAPKVVDESSIFESEAKKRKLI